MTALGYTHQNLKEEIRTLSIENYSRGPLPDRIYMGEMWEFGKIIAGREIYIKLQLSAYNDPGDLIETLFCISFHFAEFPMRYPYKQQ